MNSGVYSFGWKSKRAVKGSGLIFLTSYSSSGLPGFELILSSLLNIFIFPGSFFLADSIISNGLSVVGEFTMGGSDVSGILSLLFLRNLLSIPPLTLFVYSISLIPSISLSKASSWLSFLFIVNSDSDMSITLLSSNSGLSFRLITVFVLCCVECG